MKGHRVVSIVEKRSPMPWPGLEYDRGFHEDQWYGGPRNYQDVRECHGEGSYLPNDRRYFDESPSFGSFHRNPSPPRNEGMYFPQYYSRDDLRHQLSSRNNVRPGSYSRNRGRGSGPSQRPTQNRKAKEGHGDHRVSSPAVITRDRSPVRREAQPGRCGSNTSSNRSFSPDKDKGHKSKPSVQRSNSSGSSVEDSAHSSGSSKEKTPASVAESEEVAAASMEPKPTPEEELQTRRLEAIKAKALEIEKLYRQDCETFRTVVKMLVAKEPSLDNLLKAPLDENLLEIKQRCLDSLRHFVKELDEVVEKPDTSAAGHKTLE